MTERILHRVRCLVGTACCAAAGWGCRGDAPAPVATDDAPPLRMEDLRKRPTLQVAEIDPNLRTQRYSVLLNFEQPSDDAFVFAGTPDAPAGQGDFAIDATEALTGQAALRVGPGTRAFTIRLGSLFAGRDFPADWTLLGVSLRAEADASVAMTLTLEDGGKVTRQAALRAGAWGTVWIDLTALAPSARPAALCFEIDGRTTVWLDDLLVTDNSAWLVGESEASQPWSIRRRGFVIVLTSPGRFRATLDTAQSRASGFSAEEITPLRARFAAAGGDVRHVTFYSDGRSFWDGAFRPLSPEARSEPPDQHTAPAQITVPAAMGRVERRSDGDANNDGYNERTGAYQVFAGGPRIDVTITPRSKAVWRPVLEIAGLPPSDNVLVTVEGRLVEGAVRTPEGALLVQLPFRIDRATTVNVRAN